MYFLKLEKVVQSSMNFTEYTTDDFICPDMSINTLHVPFYSLDNECGNSYMNVLMPKDHNYNVDSLFELPNREQFLCDIWTRKKLIEPLHIEFSNIRNSYARDEEKFVLKQHIDSLRINIDSLELKISQLKSERDKKIVALKRIKKEIS